ncbi:hypothetical protein ACIA8G_33355 [Lentzea sp. NPDC051213]|uniref:hypothetical protein n=1 Tax=Lentzea sp. NPDC051213 TaxID=3364126 RepID=UPI0037ACCFCB
MTGSVRMIFEFGANGVRLVEQHPVNAPRNVTGLAHEQQAGDYVEVRDRDGQTLSRVPVRAGVGSSVETFPEDPYISADTPHVLTVVVPAPPDADHVAVVRYTGTAVGIDTEVLGTFRLSL